MADVVRDKKLVSDAVEAAISELDKLNKVLDGLAANMSDNQRLEEFDITSTLESSKEMVTKAGSEVKSV